MNDSHLGPGAVIADRYVVESLLGVGGLAEVYKVRHTELGSLHALKLLTLRRKSFDERLKQEGQIQARLRHPNVVTVTDMVRIDGQVGLVMEYVDGSALDALIAERHQVPYTETMVLFAPVLAAVAWAHDAGAVHRDLKPGNVLLARTPVGWVPKVADFGIGKLLDAAEGESAVGKTRSGVAMGTPGYMAPEQVRDSATVDKRADVFALGVILFEMLSGTLPFVNEDGSTDVTTTLVRDASPLVAPDVPLEVVEAIAKAIRKEPADRHLDARAFAMALGLGGHPLFSDATGGGSLQDVTRSLSTSWPGPRTPNTGEPNATLAPTSTPNTAAPPSLVTAAPQPAGGRNWFVWIAIPTAAAVLGVALLALLISSGMLMTKVMDPEEVVVAPPPAPVPPGPAPVDLAPVPTPTPSPEVAPEVAPSAPAPAPTTPAPTPPAPEVPAPQPDAVVAVAEPVPAVPAPVVPEPVVVAPAPQTPMPTPTPTPTPAPSGPAPDLSGTWSGRAAGRPFELTLTGPADALSASAVFLVGSTRRVEKLSGALNSSSNVVSLRSADGKIRFDGLLSGTTLSGNYMMEGAKALPFSVRK